MTADGKIEIVVASSIYGYKDHLNQICDVFFGVLRPFYGSGIIGDTAITHEEMKKAIELKNPRWFVAHRDIRVARVVQAVPL